MAGWHWEGYTTRLMSGHLSPPMAANLGFSLEGCAYRGSLVCLRCPFQPAAECDYRCATGNRTRVNCPERYRCKCGWDQTGTLAAMGLVT